MTEATKKYMFQQRYDGSFETPYGLTEAQAYHVWLLSHSREDGSNGVPPSGRISRWFTHDVRQRFRRYREAGITPADLYRKEQRHVISVRMLVDAPIEMNASDVLSEIRDVVNVVTEDTKIKIKGDE